MKLWYFDIFQLWYSNILIFSKTVSSDTLIIFKTMSCDTLLFLNFANQWVVIFWYREHMHKYKNWLWRLQSDCGDCSLFFEIALWFWRLQSNSRDCSLIVEIAVWNVWNERDFWTKGQCLEFLKSSLLNQWGASILGSLPMGSLYFRSSDFDSLPK